MENFFEKNGYDIKLFFLCDKETYKDVLLLFSDLKQNPNFKKFYSSSQWDSNYKLYASLPKDENYLYIQELDENMEINSDNMEQGKKYIVVVNLKKNGVPTLVLGNYEYLKDTANEQGVSTLYRAGKGIEIDLKEGCLVDFSEDEGKYYKFTLIDEIFQFILEKYNGLYVEAKCSVFGKSNKGDYEFEINSDIDNYYFLEKDINAVEIIEAT